MLKPKRKSSQWRLYKIVQEILPDIAVIEEFVHPILKFSSGFPMIFDIFVPTLNLVFEYQGQQHYHNIQYFGDSIEFQVRDTVRREACSFAGITLIEVPYWWKRDKESVVTLIRACRPDIVLQSPETRSYLIGLDNNPVQ